MKAVLVIDVPECICTYCPIYNMGDSNDDYRDLWCSKGCLLKPLPEMIDADAETDMSGGYDYASGYRDGWNRGIEIGWNRYRKAITGEADKSESEE